MDTKDFQAYILGISKPVSSRELRAKLERWARSSSQNQDLEEIDIGEHHSYHVPPTPTFDPGDKKVNPNPAPRSDLSTSMQDEYDSRIKEYISEETMTSQQRKVNEYQNPGRRDKYPELSSQVTSHESSSSSAESVAGYKDEETLRMGLNRSMERMQWRMNVFQVANTERERYVRKKGEMVSGIDGGLESWEEEQMRPPNCEIRPKMDWVKLEVRLD